MQMIDDDIQTMSEDDALYYLFDLESEYKSAIYYEWFDNKGKEGAFQKWSVLPSAMVQKEYRYYARTGLVHDKQIERIQEICIENYLKLHINTILFGHDSIDSFAYMEGDIPEEMTKEEFDLLFEDFEWFACDENGNWRISDYGLRDMGEFCLQMLMESRHERKLYWIDRILNIVHQRSNLSSWFIEGGANTLDNIFQS